MATTLVRTRGFSPLGVPAVMLVINGGLVLVFLWWFFRVVSVNSNGAFYRFGVSPFVGRTWDVFGPYFVCFSFGPSEVVHLIYLVWVVFPFFPARLPFLPCF